MNPFRRWDDFFASSTAKKAMGAWKTARSTIAQLGSKPARSKARKALRDFVAVFNQLDQKSGLETDQREQIHAEFVNLAAMLPKDFVTEDDYSSWAEYA